MNSTICTLLCVFAPECARNSDVDSCKEILERDILLQWEKDSLENDIYNSDGDKNMFSSFNFPRFTLQVSGRKRKMRFPRADSPRNLKNIRALDIEFKMR